MFYLHVHEAPVDTLRLGVGLVHHPENLSATTEIMPIGLVVGAATYGAIHDTKACSNMLLDVPRLKVHV